MFAFLLRGFPLDHIEDPVVVVQANADWPHMGRNSKCSSTSETDSPLTGLVRLSAGFSGVWNLPKRARPEVTLL